MKDKNIESEAAEAVRSIALLGDPIQLAKDSGRSASSAVKELTSVLTRYADEYAVRPKDSEDGRQPLVQKQKG